MPQCRLQFCKYINRCMLKTTWKSRTNSPQRSENSSLASCCFSFSWLIVRQRKFNTREQCLWTWGLWQAGVRSKKKNQTTNPTTVRIVSSFENKHNGIVFCLITSWDVEQRLSVLNMSIMREKTLTHWRMGRVLTMTKRKRDVYFAAQIVITAHNTPNIQGYYGRRVSWRVMGAYLALYLMQQSISAFDSQHKSCVNRQRQHSCLNAP